MYFMFKKLIGSFLVSSLLLGVTSNVYADEAYTLNNADDVYDRVVDLKLFNIEENGELEFLGNKEDLNVNPNIYNEFLDKISSINFLVDKGIAHVENDFEVKVATPEEITEIAYSEGNGNLVDINDNSNVSPFNYKNNTYNRNKSITPYAVDPGLPKINLTSLVVANRKELKTLYESLLRTSPTGAYPAAVGYFVGKVREKGPWDYKIQPGYKYWYKEWQATTYAGTKIINSEYIGNYNYSYVGELLFSKTVLLKAGAAIGKGVGQKEDAKDKDAITLGYNDAVKYGK